MGKVVTREWRKAKSAELEIAFVSASREIQVQAVAFEYKT